MRRVVFLGEKPHGHECLRVLLDRDDVEMVAVATRAPQQDVWWGRQRVRELAEERGVPIIDRAGILELEQVDFLISVLYPFVIEAEVLATARVAAVNLHQAPLPEYRGCNGASHAIINGERTWGGTLHLMSAELDQGDIIEKRCFAISESITARELYDANDANCIEVFRDNLDAILDASFKATPQNPSAPTRTYARDSLADKRADPSWPQEKLERFVRGMEFPPFESAYFLASERKIYLTTSEDGSVVPRDEAPETRSSIIPARR
jgi:methionyl-tRNA formyltransferase